MSEIDLMAELDDPCPRGCGRTADECEEAEDGGQCAGSELVRRLERALAEEQLTNNKLMVDREELGRAACEVIGNITAVVAIPEVTGSLANRLTVIVDQLHGDWTLRGHLLADLEAKLAEAQRERDTFRQHSIWLNTIGFKAAEALGRVPEGADAVQGNPIADVELLIALRDSYRQRSTERREAYKRLVPIVTAAKEVVHCWKTGRMDNYSGIAENRLSAAVDALVAAGQGGADPTPVAASGPTSNEDGPNVETEVVRNRIDQLLQLSMGRINDATDPDSDEAHFRCRLEAGALAAQAAYGLTVLAKHLSPSDCYVAAGEMAELGMDGEVLVSWVGEELNRAGSRAGQAGDDGLFTEDVTVRLQRLALIARTVGPIPNDLEDPDDRNYLAEEIWDALQREGCRDCPPGCSECTVDRDCECYVHPDAGLGADSRVGQTGEEVAGG